MSGASSFTVDVGKRVNVGHHCCIIERVIAEGGYGVVFLVRSDRGAKFALKRLYVNDEGRLRDCKSEIDILSSLSGYKNILKYIDSSIHRLANGVHEVLILTEYYPGVCAQLMEARGFISEGEILKIFCDMCQALSVLHHCQIPIIHRDVKLENILVDHQRNYVLCDFGSATRNSYIVGQHSKSVRELEEDFHQHTTASHRAPEIADLYSNQNITTKIDIWALGVTLYRLCFNNLPFGESSLAIQSGQFTIPERSTYSHIIHALIYYCLEVDPEKRPDIYQVSTIALQLIGRQSSLNTNLNHVTVPTAGQVIEMMRKRQQSQNAEREQSSRHVTSDRSEWVETTTVKPRERPRAGRHLAVTSSLANSGLSHSDMSLHVGTSAHGHTANLAGSSQDNVSPFGDDFSQYDLRSTPAGNGSTTQASSNMSHAQRPPKLVVGFEDSFNDLLTVPSNTTSKMQGNTQQPNSQLSAEFAKGHRRYKSDTASILPSSRQLVGGYSLSTNAPPTRTVDDFNQGSAPSSSPSPFDDDFSSFTTNQLPTANQKPGGGNSNQRKQLDLFGCEPFDPLTVDRSSQQASWKYANDRNFLSGFS